MMKETIAVSTTVKGAVTQGAIALGCDVSEVKYDVLEEPKRKGFLGLGGKSLAKVRVYFEREDTPEEKAAKAAAKAAQEKRAAEKEARRAERERAAQSGARPPKKDGTRAQRQPKEKKEPKELPEIQLPKEPPKPKIPADLSHPAVTYVKTLCDNLGIEAQYFLDPTPDAGGAQHFDIEGESASVLIGHHGETLDALQYLTNLALHCGNEDGEVESPRIKLDVQEYRVRRDETLRRLAVRKAKLVLKNERNFTFEPMNPYERRIIHATVQSVPGVSSHSIGSGNSRRVVVTLDDGGAKEASAE